MPMSDAHPVPLKLPLRASQLEPAPENAGLMFPP